MIHESLARKNKLSVGDKLTLSNFQMTEGGTKEMTFDIVGIFSRGGDILECPQI